MQPICGYMGPCRLHITSTAIIVSHSNGDELATWLFNCIRQFNAIDCHFSFTSGRRGPFGVDEYCFELPQKKVVEIQKKISGHTGAIFAHNRNYSSSSTLSASTNVSNPSKPKVPVTDDNSRSRSESETAPSAPLSSNLYPLTTPPKTMTYQNTGIRRAIAPPLPSKDPVKPPMVALQNDKKPNVQYVNAMKGAPKPLPRTMKPSVKKTDDNKAPAYSTVNSTATSSLPHTDGSFTLPTHSQRSQVITTDKTVVNPVGSHSDLNRDPLDYGDMVCSPHGPDTNHKFFSPPPPSINSGYSDVDYDVIRRNREIGKFSDPEGTYKDKKSMETYDVPSSLQVTEDTYDVPWPTGGKFEDIPDVYEDDTKHSSPDDLYNVPTSNQQVPPDLYDVPPVRGKTATQTPSVPSRQNQLYDNPPKPVLSTVTTHDEPHDLYDTPQSNQPVTGGHETYDVVPSRRACSSSPQPQVVIMPKKPVGYENIGPHGEILGEIVANQLRQDLLSSLNGSDRHWMPRPLKNTNSNFSRSCEFLNEISQEPSKRFSTSSNYRRLIIPEQEIAQNGTLPASSWHTYKLHRRLSGSLGDVPTVEACDDDDTYVVLNKTEKPNRKLPIPAPKPRPVAASSINGMEDDGESNDMYIAMNRSPSHSSSSIVNTETLPKGYIRMSTAKEALVVKKSNSSTEIGRKETSPTNNEGRRNSDLVWPTNSGWSHWNLQDEQASRKSSDSSEVFSPPPATHEHPIVVSKSSVRPKRSVLLKGVSPQPVPGQEKRMSE